MKRLGLLLLWFLLFILFPQIAAAGSDIVTPSGLSGNSIAENQGGPQSVLVAKNDENETAGGVMKSEPESEPVERISDPLESMNRKFFTFNDKLYFYVLKPVARGYGKILPKRVRLSIQDFFLNLYSPIRMVNCGLQGDPKGAATELARFVTNSTIGVAGLFDPAKSLFKLEMHEEDFGQTLGCYTGPGVYLNLPFLGPYSFRDGIGFMVDMFIVPSYYVLLYCPWYTTVAPQALEKVNTTSLTIGEYEELKNAALDPYVAVRNAYYQHREDLIKR